MMMRVWLIVVLAGCWSRGAETNPATTSTTTPQASCQRGKPPAGRCVTTADCGGRPMECVAKPPGPHVRVTGIGAMYGTDDAECTRPDLTCPAGEVALPGQAPNLCPTAHCAPKCTPTSCAQGESCDGERCRPTSCTQGYACGAGEACRRDLWSDPHGCSPRCPDFGYCIKNAPVG